MENEEIVTTFYNTLMNICIDSAREDMKRRINNMLLIFNSEKNSHFKSDLEKLLETKMRKIRKYNIKFDYNIVDINKFGNIESKDFTELINSFLENSINLCKNIEDKNLRWIEFNIHIEDSNLFMDIFNSINPKRKIEKDSQNFKILEKFLKKYNGILHSCESNFDTFFVEIQITSINDMIKINLSDSKKYLFKNVPLYNYLATH